MKRSLKQSKESSMNNDYLNFIKKNHLRMLAEGPVKGHNRSRSKGEQHTDLHKKIQQTIPLVDNKTLTIQVEEPPVEQVFPAAFNGSNFSSFRSQKRRLDGVRLSNAEIESIIEDKRQSIMKIVYESVQISISNKKVLLKSDKAMVKGQRKSIVRLIDFEKEVNDAKEVRDTRDNKETNRESKDNKVVQENRDSTLKLPEIALKKETTSTFPRLLPTNQAPEIAADDQTSPTVCYNDYIRNNYLDVNLSQGIDRKLSQQLPLAARRKRISYPSSQRYEQNEKLIRTFYEYERLMQLKELRIQQHRLKINQDARQNTKNVSPKRLAIAREERVERLSGDEQSLLKDSKEIVVEPVEKHDKPIVKELEEDTICETEDIQNPDSPTRKPTTRLLVKPKNYALKEKQMTVYDHKISTYRDFIFKVNLAHGRFDALLLKEDINYHKNDFKYRAYVGRGNNSLLIRSLLKRRFWWVIEEDHKNCHFIWTQLKINGCFDREKPCQLNHCLEEEEPGSKDMQLTKKKKSQQTNQQSRSKLKPELPKGHDKIMNIRDRKLMDAFDKLQLEPQRLDDMDYRMKFLDKKLLPVDNPSAYVVHNHLECNYHIGNKKAMFYNLRQYYELLGKDVFAYLPLTFHIKKGLDDKDYKTFVKYFKKREQLVKAYDSDDEERGRSKPKKQRRPRNIWIVKPGEISNRGNGITVIDELYELNKILKNKEKHPNGNDKTYIVQAYLDRPLLYHRRKFDIRHYMLITTLYGRMKAYWYSQGYIRTSSCQFTLNDLTDPMVHLTNDAIQKYGSNYGRYEEGNKISYAEFQRYLDQNFAERKLSFYDAIYPKMREVARDAVRSTYLRLDPKRLQHNFEVFGLDFMIDQDFNVWLIEINTNPCLEISSGLLGRIIPTMVEHAFRLSLDVLFPPIAHYPNTQKHLAPDNALDNLKFELIFDEEVDGKELRELYKSVAGLDCGEIDQEEETYENDGKEYDQDII